MELFTTLFTGMWAVVGVILLVIGLVLSRSEQADGPQPGAETSGTVVDMRFIQNGQGNAWHPVIGFYVNGEYITQVSPFGGNHNAYEIGQQVTVHYQQDDPSKYCPQEEAADHRLISFFLYTGVGCIAIGLLVGVFLTLFL